MKIMSNDTWSLSLMWCGGSSGGSIKLERVYAKTVCFGDTTVTCNAVDPEGLQQCIVIIHDRAILTSCNKELPRRILRFYMNHKVDECTATEFSFTRKIVSSSHPPTCYV